MVTVAVTERRRWTLSPEQRGAIDASDGFWRLADEGYVSYRRAGPAVHQVVGHKYVGRAIVGDLELLIEEKASGTVLALVRAATGAELKIHRVDAPATTFDVVSQHLMREFVTQAGRYVADRRRGRYSYHEASGLALGGQINLARTIGLNAAGHVGQFAYTAGRVVRDEPLDRLVLAGLDELGKAATALDLAPETVYHARWLAGALEEIRDYCFWSAGRSDFLEVAESIEREATTLVADADLARLAAVALLHRGFEPHLPSEGTVPRAWFIDLETLFEQAVRETLRDLLGGFDVDRGLQFDRRMFNGGDDSSRTYPDVVVYQTPVVAGVGDVKYKTLRAAPGGESGEDRTELQAKKEGRADLYQVLIHAASVSADLACLIYVSDDEYVSRYLGRSATGCDTWTVQVRPVKLRADLCRFLGEIGLLP